MRGIRKLGHRCPYFYRGDAWLQCQHWRDHPGPCAAAGYGETIHGPKEKGWVSQALRDYEGSDH